MNFPILQDLPPSRWDDMCRRLEPLLGDVRGALGAQWHEKAEALFTEADLVVAGSVLRLPKSTPDWFVIRYAPAALHFGGDGDGLSCSPSWTEALAVVLGACETNRCLPSRIEYDQGQRTLRLFVREETLATIEPLVVAYVSSQARRRAISTICGLRRAGDVNAELIKRARRWPGMDRIVQANSHANREIQEFREQMAHHPIPLEWLLSARLLCIACGKTDPSTATVQAVAATALGAQSWNHLAAPHGEFSARLLQPWYVCKDDAPYAFHADAIDAFADLFARAPQWMAGWFGTELTSQYSFGALDYMPTYKLVEPAPALSGAVHDERQVVAYPVIRADAPADELIDRVTCVAAGGAEAISSLFCIGLPVDTKSRMLDERAQEILIVQDGEWRFTRTGDPTDEGALLWVYRVGPDGNSVGSAAVPTYKGLLQSHRESGTYVLCADYDGAHPVAVIDGLTPVAAAQVRANLPATAGWSMEFEVEAHRPRDREDFRKLLKTTLARRSMA